MAARGIATGAAAEALGEELDVGPHLAQRVRVAEPVFVDGFVEDGGAVDLCEEDDEWLLPVGHEAGVHVGFDMDIAFEFSFGEKFDAVRFDMEAAADFADFIEEGDHVAVFGAFNEDAPFGADRSDGVGGDFIAVGEDGVFDVVKLGGALNVDRAVDVDCDLRAELLEEEDDVEHFGLEGGVLDDGGAFGADSGEEGVFGGADRGVVEADDGALQAVVRLRKVSTLFFHDAVFDFRA